MTKTEQQGLLQIATLLPFLVKSVLQFYFIFQMCLLLLKSFIYLSAIVRSPFIIITKLALSWTVSGKV
jgi:hypothetical protein